MASVPNGSQPGNNANNGGPSVGARNTPNNSPNNPPNNNTNNNRNRNNQNPLISVRDRLFHALFFKIALAYAQTVPW